MLFSKSDAVWVHWAPRFFRLALDPKGRFLAAGGIIATRREATTEFGVTLISLDRENVRGLAGSEGFLPFDVAIDPEGRRLAAGAYVDPEVRVWELESGKMSRFEFEEPPRPGDSIYPMIASLRFLPDGPLLISTLSGKLWRLDPETGEREHLLDEVANFDLSRDGRYLLSCFRGKVSFHDLLERTSRVLSSHGEACSAVALDPSGTIAVSADNSPPGGRLGMLRVGPVTGEEPQLLFGHEATVWPLAVSPGGDRIASAAVDGTIRLWTMPDVSRPALQTLPLDELLARLRAFTNARVVRDDAAPERYRVEWEPISRWPRHPED